MTSDGTFHSSRACLLSRFSPVRLFATPWIVACEAPLSMGFSRHRYWSGLPFPPPRDLPDPGIHAVPLVSPVLAGRLFTSSVTCMYRPPAAGLVLLLVLGCDGQRLLPGLGSSKQAETGLEPGCSDPDPVSFPSSTHRGSVPASYSSPEEAPPGYPHAQLTTQSGAGGRGRHAEPRLRAHPCPPWTQAACFMGRSTPKAVAGSPLTAPAPPARVTRVSSPVPASSVSPPVPSPTRGPVTAALGALVCPRCPGRGEAGGGKEAEPVSISLPLPWAGWPPFLYTLQSLRLGGPRGREPPPPAWRPV